jgi:parallel beta-helix repeat protein
VVMKKAYGEHYSGIAIGITMLGLLLACGESAATTITVNASGGADYTRIQDAINGSNNGDTIQVYSGTYYENLNVSKQLILQGIDNGGGKPVVDAGGIGSAITLRAGSSTIEGFIAVNASTSQGDSGINVPSRYNIIRNNNLSYNSNGIYLSYENNTLIGNNASYNNQDGIALVPASRNNTLRGNIADNNNRDGIHLEDTYNNTLIGNNASINNGSGIYLIFDSNNILIDNKAFNNRYGIFLIASTNDTLIKNIMKENKYNFGLEADVQSDFLNNQIDSTNLVNDKPIYYIKDVNNVVYDSSTNAGTFYCLSCVNVTIKDLNLNANSYGIFLWNTSYSRIQNITASDNEQGIFLSNSSNNSLKNNILNDNTYNFGISEYYDELTYNNQIDITNSVDGKPIYYMNYASDSIFDSSVIAGTFYCISCVNVTIKDLNLNANRYGIFLWNTSYSKIQNITVSKNLHGIFLINSINNTLESNDLSNNYYGIDLVNSSNNTVNNNNVSSNSIGIQPSYSNSTTLRYNNVSNNTIGIELGWFSYRSLLIGNNVSFNEKGIFLIISGNNSIYDNYFNNFVNYDLITSFWYGNIFFNYENSWNITKTAGTNILGDKYLGGNFWANPAGAGLSQTCPDADKDGICDAQYTLDSNNIDYLPLSSGTVIVAPTDTAPAIESITAVNISYASADIIFILDQSDAITIVSYGTTESLGEFSSWNNNTDLSRRIVLSNLNESTKYYYSIYAYNGSNQSCFSNSTIQSFTTKSPSPTILSYYRGLGNDPNVVETTDLLKAADDWSNNIAPSGFASPITTQQLLSLADEWSRS